MFLRKNIKYLKLVLHSRSQAASAGSMTQLGNLIKRFAKFLRDHCRSEGDDKKAIEFDGFLCNIRHNWGELFAESECQTVINRSETRKLVNLPDQISKMHVHPTMHWMMLWATKQMN